MGEQLFLRCAVWPGCFMSPWTPDSRCQKASTILTHCSKARWPVPVLIPCGFVLANKIMCPEGYCFTFRHDLLCSFSDYTLTTIKERKRTQVRQRWTEKDILYTPPVCWEEKVENISFSVRHLMEHKMTSFVSRRTLKLRALSSVAVQQSMGADGVWVCEWRKMSADNSLSKSNWTLIQCEWSKVLKAAGSYWIKLLHSPKLNTDMDSKV